MKAKCKMKTFYSVERNEVTWSQPRTFWFDSLEKAKKFSAGIEFTGNVIVHNFTDEEKIATAEEHINYQFMDWGGNVWNWEAELES
jgi:hypothetical protein